MTPAQMAEALLERGLPAADGPAIRSLSERVLSALGVEGEPPGAWWTPGRLEVFGTHTDYAGGHSLVCAVPRGIVLAARRRRDERVFVRDVKSGESVEITLAEEVSRFRGWRRYVAVTAARLARNFSDMRGCEIAFESTLPRASGMSSSSALVIAIASALAALNDLPQRDAWTANIRSPVDVAGYYACIENGRSFGTLGGDAGVGTHGGSEDHAAILTGRESMVTAFRFAPIARLEDVAVPGRWRFVIAPSNVRAEKTGGAQASYNHLSRQVQQLLDIWNSQYAPAATLGDALRSGPGAAERFRTLLRGSGGPSDDAASCMRRLEHFVREDAIVSRAVDAFRSADTDALAALAAESQEIAESLLQNQVPQTVRLARDARRLGAFAARSFGAGFGGSVWALVEEDAADRFVRAWAPDAFTMRPGPPHGRL